MPEGSLFERATRRLRVLPSYASVALGSIGVGDGRAWRGPIYVQVGIADPCNHRCVMCPYHPPDTPASALEPKFGHARPGLMATDRFASLVDEFVALGVRRVDLVGRGEPMLHPDLPEMVARARGAGLEVALTTNGSKLTAASCDALVDAGLTHLKVSLNAGLPETYETIHVTESPAAYARVLAGVRALTRRGAPRPHVTLSFAVGAHNVEELSPMVERAVESGADAAYFQHLVDVPDRPELTLDGPSLRRLTERLIPAARRLAARNGVETNLTSFAAEAEAKRHDPGEPVPCYAGYYFSSVLGNGAVLPCCQIDMPVGSVEAASFTETWNGEAYRAFRRASRQLPERVEGLDPSAECDRCYFRPHNVAVHRALRPWQGASTPALAVSQAVRLLRLDGD